MYMYRNRELRTGITYWMGRYLLVKHLRRIQKPETLYVNGHDSETKDDSDRRMKKVVKEVKERKGW